MAESRFPAYFYPNTTLPAVNNICILIHQMLFSEHCEGLFKSSNTIDYSILRASVSGMSK